MYWNKFLSLGYKYLHSRNPQILLPLLSLFLPPSLSVSLRLSLSLSHLNEWAITIWQASWGLEVNVNGQSMRGKGSGELRRKARNDFSFAFSSSFFHFACSFSIKQIAEFDIFDSMWQRHKVQREIIRGNNERRTRDNRLRWQEQLSSTSSPPPPPLPTSLGASHSTRLSTWMFFFIYLYRAEAGWTDALTNIYLTSTSLSQFSPAQLVAPISF